jgi:sodium transport system permease protein
LGAYDQAEVARRLELLDAAPELTHPSRLVMEEVSEPGLGTAKTLGAFLPYVLILMMFQGSMQHGIHVTAGEKERGTLQSLLATALPRSQIIWGKLAYIFCMGMIAAVLNLLSMGLSMAIAVHRVAPEATRAQADAAASLSRMADPGILLVGLLLLLPLGLLFSSFILFMGIRARSAAEAGTSLMPGLLLILVLGAVSLAPGIERMTYLAYVPVLNVSLAIRKLFSQQAAVWEIMIAFGMTAGLSMLMTWASTKLLDRETVLFRQR